MSNAIHKAHGRAVLLCWPDGEARVVASCCGQDSAIEAADLLNRARYKNDVKREYTNAARLIARAESLPGFEWVSL
jgi:hypothetical protein